MFELFEMSCRLEATSEFLTTVQSCYYIVVADDSETAVGPKVTFIGLDPSKQGSQGLESCWMLL